MKEFWIDAGKRAVRTMAQTAAGMIGTGAVVSDVDWGRVLSASAVAGILSVLMSLDRIETAHDAGTPSVPNGTMTRLQALADGAEGES